MKIQQKIKEIEKEIDRLNHKIDIFYKKGLVVDHQLLIIERDKFLIIVKFLKENKEKLKDAIFN